MIISNTQMQGVLEHLKFHPDDFTSYLVMGDLLEEDGQIDWAVTFRWLATHKKSPVPRAHGGLVVYHWYMENASGPNSLRVLVSTNIYPGKSSPSFLDAIVYAHKLLKRKRKIFTIPGDVGYVP